MSLIECSSRPIDRNALAPTPSQIGTLTVSRSFTQQDRPALEAELLELAKGVVEGRFEPTDRPHRELCQFCPGQPALCSWPPERTLAERPEGETFAAPEPEGELA